MIIRERIPWHCKVKKAKPTTKKMQAQQSSTYKRSTYVKGGNPLSPWHGKSNVHSTLKEDAYKSGKKGPMEDIAYPLHKQGSL